MCDCEGREAAPPCYYLPPAADTGGRREGEEKAGDGHSRCGRDNRSFIKKKVFILK